MVWLVTTCYHYHSGNGYTNHEKKSVILGNFECIMSHAQNSDLHREKSYFRGQIGGVAKW
jgi:hypothetical protein